MTIGVIATLKVAEGKGGDLEAAFRELIAQVKAKEPGNKMYSLFKSKSEANTYVVMEVYDDQAAVEPFDRVGRERSAQKQRGENRPHLDSPGYSPRVHYRAAISFRDRLLRRHKA